MSAVLDPIPTDAAPAAFAEAVAPAEAGKERVILTRTGKPVAALVPTADLEAIEDAEDATAAAEVVAEDRAVREGLANLHGRRTDSPVADQPGR